MIPYQTNHSYKAAAFGKKSGGDPHAPYIPKLKDVWNAEWPMPEDLTIQDNEVWMVVDKRAGAFTSSSVDFCTSRSTSSVSYMSIDVYDTDLNLLFTKSAYSGDSIDITTFPDVFLVKYYKTFADTGLYITSMNLRGTNVVAVYDASNEILSSAAAACTIGASISATDITNNTYNKLVYYKSIKSKVYTLSGNPCLIKADFSGQIARDETLANISISDSPRLSEFIYPELEWTANSKFAISSGLFSEITIPTKMNLGNKTTGANISISNLPVLRSLDLSNAEFQVGTDGKPTFTFTGSNYITNVVFPDDLVFTPIIVKNWFGSSAGSLLTYSLLNPESFLAIINNPDRILTNDTGTTITVYIAARLILSANKTLGEVYSLFKDKGYNVTIYYNH